MKVGGDSLVWRTKVGGDKLVTVAKSGKIRECGAKVNSGATPTLTLTLDRKSVCRERV